jgi:membrane-associated protein
MSISAAALTLPLVFVIAMIPLAPTEAMLLACGVLAAAGELSLVPVIVVASLGCAVADLINYRLGRVLGSHALDRLHRRSSAHAVVEWVTGQLTERGEPILVAARFVPGGGIAGAMLAGVLRWPMRRFLPVSAVGSTLWTSYAVLVGYLGGRLVEHPVLSMLLSLAVATAVSVPAGMLVRRAQRRTVAAAVAGGVAMAEVAAAGATVAGAAMAGLVERADLADAPAVASAVAEV